MSTFVLADDVRIDCSHSALCPCAGSMCRYLPQGTLVDPELRAFVVVHHGVPYVFARDERRSVLPWRDYYHSQDARMYAQVDLVGRIGLICLPAPTLEASMKRLEVAAT